MSFQTAVNIFLPVAVAGDFASTNPRANVLASSTGAGLVAGSSGVTVGAFAWVDSDGLTVSNTGSNAPHGFVHRDQNTTITVFLAEASQVIKAGFNMALCDAGDFWVNNGNSSAASVIGQKAFANNTTGLVQFAAANASVAGCTETKWYAKTAAAAGSLVKISSWS